MVGLQFLLATLCLSLINQASAQADVDQCALTCIANVDGTNCSQSQWPCLCANDMYIERMNNCTIASCNATAQQDTFTVVAQLCAIFDVPLTIGPEATVPISSSDLLFSTVAIPTQSSLPPVISSNGASASTTTVSSQSSSDASQTSSVSSAPSSSSSTVTAPSPLTTNGSTRFSVPLTTTLVLAVVMASTLNWLFVLC